MTNKNLLLTLLLGLVLIVCSVSCKKTSSPSPTKPSTNTTTPTNTNYVAPISWIELGSGNGALKANSYIYALATDNAGNIYAAGAFTNSSGNLRIAKWNGSIWQDLGQGIPLSVTNGGGITQIVIDANNNIYVSGSAYYSSCQSCYGAFVSKWDGSTWIIISTNANMIAGTSYISKLVIDKSNDLYVLGNLKDSTGSYCIAKWNGNSWANIGRMGLPNPSVAITDMLIDGSGNFYLLAGPFYNMYEVNGTSLQIIDSSILKLKKK